MLRSRAILLLIAALLAAAPAPRPVQAEDLPARVHALLLLRVLAYDRNIRQRAGTALTVVVLQQPGDHASEQRSAALRAAFEEVSKDVVVAGLPVHVTEVPYRGVAELDTLLETLHASLIEVDVSLAPVLPELLRLARRRSTSTSGTRAMAQAGAAIGVAASGGRAALTVNLPGARAEGADLDAALLDICEVIRQ